MLRSGIFKKAPDMSTIDLHMHSIHSADGEFTARQLLSRASESDLSVVAITDHDHVSAIDEAREAGRELGIAVIPSVELNCCFCGIWLHVLGYGIDHRDSRFPALADSIDRMEEAAGVKRLQLVRAMGLHIDDKRLDAIGRRILTGEILAEVALEDPANAGSPLLLPYRSGGARDDNPFVNFYWDNCAEGKPGHVHVEYQSLASAIDLIVGTGGVPVLAHPGANLAGREELLPEIAAAGVRGVEAFSSYHKPEQIAFWRNAAERLGLFFTCGSDFHGKTKPAVAMGRHGCEYEDEVLAALKKSLPLDSRGRF